MSIFTRTENVPPHGEICTDNEHDCDAGKDAIQSKKTAGTVTTIDGLLTFHSYYVKVETTFR